MPFFALLCLAGVARAQTPAEMREALRARATAPSFNSPAATAALEGAFDARQYRVGPGDVFSVSIGGAEPVVAALAVTADGVLVLPSAGAVDVSGLALDQARARVVEALRPFYRNVSLDVALAQPRRFLVHVTGAVPAPGRKTAGAAARLDDVLAEAFYADSLTEATWIEKGFAPSLRQVEIAHQDGTRETYDVQRYRRTGDLGQNPYLRDGDRIGVAAYQTSRQSVYVSGGVAFPGAYEYRAGDTVAGLVQLAGGPAEMSGRMVRVGDAPPAPFESVRGALVAPGTTVYVEEDRDAGTATVEGFVRFPGTYPIVQGRTTLQDLLRMAGGLLPGALGRGAYLQRRYSTNQASTFNAAYRAVQAPGDLPFVTRSALSDQFFETRLALEGGGLAGNGGADIPLYDGDALVVPRDEGTVLLIGAVTRPGYVPVQQDGSVAAYLRAAGGLRQAARDVFVMRAGTNQMRPAAEMGTLASGDVVLVTTADQATRPDLYAFSLQERQLTLQENTARRDARFRTASTLLTTVSTAVAVITTYLLVRDNARSN